MRAAKSPGTWPRGGGGQKMRAGRSRHGGKADVGERVRVNARHESTATPPCRLAGVNAVEYRTDILPRLARRVLLCDLPDLLPARWQTLRNRQKAAQAAAVSVARKMRHCAQVRCTIRAGREEFTLDAPR
jgi:hypothetical protein